MQKLSTRSCDNPSAIQSIRSRQPSPEARPRAPPGEKRSGEQSRISWAYYSKVGMTNEIARLVLVRGWGLGTRLAPTTGYAQ